MAAGDITVFNAALEKMLDGNWASTDNFYCAICDNTTTPTASTATPTLSTFTEVGTLGNYVANGTNLGALSTLVTESAGVLKFDSTTNPSYVANASNDADASWGIIYNFTDAGKDAVAFVDLGTVDMSVNPLTINWPANGIFTITRV